MKFESILVRSCIGLSCLILSISALVLVSSNSIANEVTPQPKNFASVLQTHSYGKYMMSFQTYPKNEATGYIVLIWNTETGEGGCRYYSAGEGMIKWDEAAIPANPLN